MPIWWGVELQRGGVGEASIVVHPQHTYRGTRRYLSASIQMVLCMWICICLHARSFQEHERYSTFSSLQEITPVRALPAQCFKCQQLVTWVF